MKRRTVDAISARLAKMCAGEEGQIKQLLAIQAIMSMDLCPNCGAPPGQCQPTELPDGCECGPGKWVTCVLPICEEYEPEEGGYCANCQHEFECHAEEMAWLDPDDLAPWPEDDQ